MIYKITSMLQWMLEHVHNPWRQTHRKKIELDLEVPGKQQYLLPL